MKKIETVMTYDQWKSEYKKRLRKMVMDTATTCFNWVFISLIFAGLPFGMLVHWITVGY